MHKTFVEHAEHDVNGKQRGKDQQRLAVQRVLEQLGAALKTALDRGGHADAVERVGDRARGVGQRNPDREVERDRRGNELPLVVDRQRRIVRAVAGKRGQRYLLAVSIAHEYVVQCLRALPVLRRGFHDHAVLVECRVDC